MTYLVTGSSGFIGWRVSQMLLERGDTVVGVDNMNNAYDPALKEWRLSTLLPRDRFAFHREDILDRGAMEKLFDEHAFDAVINLAARAGVRASVEDPWIYYETNVTGTLNLLECCRTRGVKKFVLASTSSLYGLGGIPFREDDRTSRVLSPYAASKKAAEVLCVTYHYLHGLDISIPRFFTVYGPGGRPDMSIFIFIDRIARGLPIRIYGDGSQSRDFTYIDDIARGAILALKPVGYEIFNLGNHTVVGLMDVVRLIEEGLGKKAAIEYLPHHPADVLATWADIGRARELFGWAPAVSIGEGIKRAIDWYRKELVHAG